MAMELLNDNIEYRDCTIVAIYNALVVAGLRANYKRIRTACIKKGWYDPNIGFNNERITEALEHFGLEYKQVPQGTSTKNFARKVREGRIFLLLCVNPYFTDSAGHSMVAMKGTRGVKVINPVYTGEGWRSISRDMKNNHIWISGFEVKRAS